MRLGLEHRLVLDFARMLVNNGEEEKVRTYAEGELKRWLGFICPRCYKRKEKVSDCCRECDAREQAEGALSPRPLSP